MKGIGFVLLILLNGSWAYAQDVPQVPSQMDFGGIRLKINEYAQ